MINKTQQTKFILAYLKAWDKVQALEVFSYGLRQRKYGKQFYTSVEAEIDLNKMRCRILAKEALNRGIFVTDRFCYANSEKVKVFFDNKNLRSKIVDWDIDLMCYIVGDWDNEQIK